MLQATNGSLYFIWSGWPGKTDGLQNLYIAPMSNPWTLSGPRVLLSTPDLPWESWIQEGPVALQRGGKAFVIYAANLSWTDNANNETGRRIIVRSSNMHGCDCKPAGICFS